MNALTDFNWTPLAPSIAFGLSIAGNLMCLAALIRSCVLIYRLRAELEARDITEAWTQAERREVPLAEAEPDPATDGPVGIAAWDGLKANP